jgi:hypothetical protein
VLPQPVIPPPSGNATTMIIILTDNHKTEQLTKCNDIASALTFTPAVKKERFCLFFGRILLLMRFLIMGLTKTIRKVLDKSMINIEYFILLISS